MTETMTPLPASVRKTCEQSKDFGPKRIKDGLLTAHVRWDDELGNGHNTFSITGTVRAARLGGAGLLRKVKATSTIKEQGKRPDGLMSDMPKGSRHFRATFERGAKMLTIWYSQGPGITDEPTAARILESALDDARSVAGRTLEEFCGDMGMDTDSRKAERIYMACETQRANLERFLGAAYELGIDQASGDGYVRGGCIHEDIAAAFPDLAPLVRWHLVSSDGPMHYLENTIYHLERADDFDKKPIPYAKRLEIARGAACWPDATEAELPDLAAPIMRACAWCLEADERTKADAYRPACPKCGTFTALKPGESRRTYDVRPDLKAETRARLVARLPALMAEFQRAVESLGFTY